MKIEDEMKKVEAELQSLKERFLVLTGAKEALTNVLKAFAEGAPFEPSVKENMPAEGAEKQDEAKASEP